MAQIMIIAKEPVAGRVKTRLTPPYSPEQAARLAGAAFHDSLLAVSGTPATQRVLALDGLPGSWLPPGFVVIPQRGPAADGGFWLLGLREPDASLLLGVPMSHPETGKLQLDRLDRAGLSVQVLPELIDVDTPADAAEVAAQAPDSRFAAVLRETGR
ncbi:TIGR04282 family arsenosugar biosynthesis glycosyltransferase [Nonomuraea jabiensis]|uniref:Glycosyltransferase A (GT-A) superfamily protein (DUF2064 family) n=1 Tax=Nonomuraea jabiensis TaxID=882448 RepID=A0A7W9LGH5_9ACTN|nr:glycosyltransferase [Nonomuraea jabiensis]MBB5782848.1 glycosyltransferase A (GT-A) superfamily protein (DUF2064 family) [Nonomuraea jabiensis]